MFFYQIIALRTCGRITNELQCTDNIGNIYIHCQYQKQYVNTLAHDKISG
jgi:hypothetical protein